MQITPSQNAPLEANQAKTNSLSTNETVSTQTNTQLDSQAKAVGTLAPDVVNIGNNKASTEATYDIKTMTRQTMTTNVSGSHTGVKPAAADRKDEKPVTTNVSGSHTGVSPAAADRKDEKPVTTNVSGSHTGVNPA
ncbi:MAG: hypothetical protein ACI9LM_005526 [Alteromonadaceae bacterium]|jgi:hypothetical protein